MVAAEDGLYEVRQGGVGARPLFRGRLAASFGVRLKAAPAGGRAAFISYEDDAWNGLALNLASFPSGEVKRITPLLPEDVQLEVDADFGSPFFEAVRATTSLDSLAWSPDGKQLAFIGALDGSSADLYLYDLARDQVTRLSDEPGEAAKPVWSPNGRWIAFSEVDSFGTGAGWAVQGVWAASPQTGELAWLGKARYTLGEETQGWLAPERALVSSWMDSCGLHNLRAISVLDKAEQVIWPEYFTQLVGNPSGEVYLLGVEDYGEGCNPSLARGIFYFSTDESVPRKLLDAAAPRLAYSPAAGLFFARTEEGVFSISLSGAVEKLPVSLPLLPEVSEAGGRWAWGGTALDPQQGAWVGAPGEGEPRQIFSEAVGFVSWAPGGESLFVSSGGRLYMARPPDFQPQALEALPSGDPLDWDLALFWVTP